MMKRGDIEILRQIAEHEKTIDWSKEGAELGWEWRDVRIQPATLTRLFLEGLLDCPFKSNSYTGYRLSETGKQILTAGEHITIAAEYSTPEVAVPPDLFEIIEGYDDIKDLLLTVLGSEKAVHLLFTGVPASAKTMFLMELARLGAPYILGSQSSRAGIAEVLFDMQPGILIVDEIDRIGNKDISILLSLMATGVVSQTKHNNRREVKLVTKVFAASNTLKLARELLSRFMVLEFKPYSMSDFLIVATNVLVRQEGTDVELARYIAEKVWQNSPRFPDPRQAVRVARLVKTNEEVDKVFDLINRYSS